MLVMKHLCHFILVNDEHCARRDRQSISHTKRLTCKAPLAKEVAGSQNCDDGLFASCTQRGNLHRAFLYIHDALSGRTLRKNNLGSLNSLTVLATPAESRKAWALNVPFFVDKPLLWDLLLLAFMIVSITPTLFKRTVANDVNRNKLSREGRSPTQIQRHHT